jgi:hypothetical protein
MTVLERAAQEVADAAAQPPFLFQLPLEKGRAIFHEIQSSDVAKPDADVPVTAVRCMGTIHDFMLLNALRETNAARAATAQTIDSLRHAFGTQS